GVQLVAAVVALVTARAVVAADRAGAFDVAVGQRASGGRTDRAARGLRDDVTVAVHGQELYLHHVRVVAGRGPGVQVVGDAEALQVVDDDAVVLVRGLFRREAFLLRLHQDRRAVLVGAGDHQHPIARHSLVSRE